MVTKELLDFLSAQHAAGMSREEMERLLISEGGWDKDDVGEALTELGILASVPPMPTVVQSVQVQETLPPQLAQDLVNDPAPVAAVEQEQTVPEEKVLQVMHGPKDAEPAQPSVVASAPVHEDFLGLLQSTHIQSAEPVQEPQSIAQEYKEEHQELYEAPVPVISAPQALDELLAPVTMPTLSVPGSVSPTPVQIATPVEANSTPAISQPAEVQSPAFTFNLAAIKDTSDTSSAPAIETVPQTPVSEPAAPLQVSPQIAPQVAPREIDALAPKLAEVVTKDIKTSSGAEMWLSSAGQKADGSQATTEAQKMTEEAKYPPRSGVRSMSQDILLRGRGSSVPGMPAMVAPMTQDEILMSQTPEQKAKIAKDKEMADAKEVERQAKAAAKLAGPTEADIAKKGRVKKILLGAIGVVLFFALLGGAVTAFLYVRGPDIATLLSGALTNFTAARSLAYSGSASSSIALSAVGDGVTRSGDVGFSLLLSGELKNDASGFGDGNHHARVAGGLHSGDYNWSTDVESDFRMIGDILYFHVLSFPAQSDLDPEVFKTYWVKIDVPEIIKELALTAGTVAQDNYGSLAGGGDKDTSFMALFTKDIPWKGGSKVGTEKVGNTDTVRIKLVVDKDALFKLVTDLYQKYTGKGLALDADGTVRMKDALAKTSIEIWVDPVTSTLAKISVTGNYDDDIAGVHAKGPLAISFEFSRYNAQVTAAVPQPLVTLDDLKVRMDDHKRLTALRAQDAAKVNTLGEIATILKEYHSTNGKYPAFLTDLRKSGAISSTTIPDALYKQVVYAAYVNPGDYSRTNKCTPKSKTCALYHIGINLDDPTDPALGSDSDIISDIRGADAGGCTGEHDTFCYDLIVSDAALGVATSTPSSP